MFLRVIWWRIRYAAWHLGWQIEFGLASWRTFHGLRVGLAPVLDEQLGLRAFEQVEAALNLVAEYEPRRMRRIASDIHRIWIKRAGYAAAYYLTELSLCVLDRNFVTAQDTPADMIAVAIVHEATHARLFKRRIPYAESLRPRIEAICDAQSAVFARRLPNGEALSRRILEGRPADASHWSNDNLDRRLLEARHTEIAAVRQELEDSDLPDWLKRMLRRVIRSRAA
jgi:hypothetical protein